MPPLNARIALVAVCMGVFLGGYVATARLGPERQPANGASAATPGRIEVHPSLICLGIVWHVQGDANENCRVAVAYREKGAGRWPPALGPMETSDARRDGCDPSGALNMTRAWEVHSHAERKERRTCAETLSR